MIQIIKSSSFFMLDYVNLVFLNSTLILGLTFILFHLHPSLNDQERMEDFSNMSLKY